MISLVQILKTAISEQASDAHISSGLPPVLRIQGQITRIEHPVLTPSQSRDLCFSSITESQKAIFERDKRLDFSFSVGDKHRFRGHLYFQKGTIAGSFRLIASEVPKIDTLGLPQSITNVTEYPHGMVLVTGPTGSGKSTTLAALIKIINETRKSHIITIEDPIEYIHNHAGCVVSQKELGQDIHSFSDGLRAALREDPDICLVGEMRDKETISNVLHTAETGHLVFSTLHTNTAFDAVERIMGVYAGDEKVLIRNQLSNCLRVIICQKLIPSLDNKRILCYEIMYMTTGIRNLIREGKQHQIYSQMQNQSREGIVTFNKCLFELVKENKISIERALEASSYPKELQQLISRGITTVA